MQRQPEREAQTTQRAILRLHPATMLLHRRLYDRQPQASTARFPIPCFIGTVEGAEDLLAIVGTDTIAVVIYCWRRNLSLMRWLDILTPGILLAQAIGRMGNRINQELYGPATTLPWGFKINPKFPYMPPLTRPLDVPVEEYIAITRFHPTFYYEAIWNLIGFALVMIFGRRWRKRLFDGDIFLFYLIWYPLGRFLVEMFRPDAWISGFGGLATAQVISLALLIVASALLVIRHVRSRGPDSAGGDGQEHTVSDAPANPGDDTLEHLTDDSV